MTPPMSVRELRLRERIDELRDQRDAALERLWDAIGDNEEIEQKLITRTRSLQEARRSRDKWRQRARDAEEMLKRANLMKRKRRDRIEAA